MVNCRFAVLHPRHKTNSIDWIREERHRKLESLIHLVRMLHVGAQFNAPLDNIVVIVSTSLDEAVPTKRVLRIDIGSLLSQNTPRFQERTRGQTDKQTKEDNCSGPFAWDASEY